MKKILIIAGSVIGVILVILIGVSMYVSSLINEDFVVQQVEGTFNLRAELAELNVGLFSGASVELRGVALGPRDSYANKGTPLSERKPMTNKTISADNVKLSLQLFPLMDGRLVVEEFIFRKPVVNLVMYRSGSNNLGGLFTTPRVVNGERNPALDAPKQQPAEPEEGADEPFQAKHLGLAGTIDTAGIENGTLNMRLAAGDKLEFRGLELWLTDIDIDPEDLENHNSAYLSLDTVVHAISRQGQEVGKFILESDGKIVPFDPKTGEVALNIRYDLNLAQSSFVTGFAVVDKLAGDLPDLRQAGVKMNDLAKKAELIRDVKLNVEYGRGLLKFLDDSMLPTKHYDFGLQKGSTIRLADSTHRFRGQLLASESETDVALAGLDRELTNALKGTGADPKEIRNKALAQVIKDGRLHFNFLSSGPLANPNVDLLAEIPSITAMIKSAGGDVLRSKLDSELKKVLPGKLGDDIGDEAKDLINKFGF